MNIILQKIKETEQLNPDEEIFLKLITENYIKDNDFLSLSKENELTYDSFLNLQKLEIKKVSNKIETITEAANLFITFLKNKNRIIILNDNDFDGTCAKSTATAVDLYLKRTYGYEHIYENYYTYGRTHGITFEQVNKILNNQTKDEVLIVTADNGINNKVELELIKEKYPKAKIIITDHHVANKNDNVFNVADIVVNTEAMSLDKKSDFLNYEINGKMIKTAYSGGYTFYLLMKEVLELLDVVNEELNSEIFTTALLSNIGDMINYEVDVMKNLQKKSNDFYNIFLIKNYINNLGYFEQFPLENNYIKLNHYISKNITLLNSARRLNSILKQFHNSSREEFIAWMKNKFQLDITKEKLDNMSLIEYIENLNNTSKKIYNNFYNNELLEDNIIYSYIKEMTPLLVMSDNSIKTDKDRILLAEAFNVIDRLNKFKNFLNAYIVSENLYETKKNDLFEVFYSKKDKYLREILSIQAFIEVDKRKSFMTLAENIEDGVKIVNGSMRSKEYLSFKKYFLENKKVLKLKDEYNIDINIYGHDLAAGIFFLKRDKTDFGIQDLNLFLDDFYKILKEENIKLEELKLNLFDVNSLQNIDSKKIMKIIFKYLYISPHPHWKPIKLHIQYKDFSNLFYNNEIVVKTSSRTGSKYINQQDRKGNTFLYFSKEKEIVFKEDEIFETELNIKYNANSSSYVLEFILNEV